MTWVGTERRPTFSGGNRANYYKVFLLRDTKTIFLHAKLKNPNRRASCVNTDRGEGEVHLQKKISWKDQRAARLNIWGIKRACRFVFDSNPARTEVCLLVRTDISKSQKMRIIIDYSRRVEWNYAAVVASRCCQCFVSKSLRLPRRWYFLRALLYLFICYLAGLHKITTGRGSRKLGGGLGLAQEGVQCLARLQRKGAGPTKVPRAGKKVDYKLEK